MAASPFAQAVSVASWEELPELLDRLQHEPREVLDQLQVIHVIGGRECLLMTAVITTPTTRYALQLGLSCLALHA